MNLVCGLALLLILVFARGAATTTAEAQGPSKFKKSHQEAPPKMVVFADSYADTGRMFNAPASHQYEEYGIGPMPWKQLYAAPDSDVLTPAYMPFEGSVTNGKPWPSWLEIPDDLNFATSSATASSPFRMLESCQGYTGEGEAFPTGTLDEQITRYFHDIGDPPRRTLDYAHIIALGINDLILARLAMSRYALGGGGYVDPVPYDLVFETDDSGESVATFEPVIEAVIEAWDDGIARLVDAGVTGTILLANMASVKGLSVYFNTTTADVLDSAAIEANLGAIGLAEKYPQVKVLDYFMLASALVDNPSIFENLGFIAPEGSFLGEPCFSQDFAVDSTAEIMGTQDLRHPDCQETCALCADRTSPCQSCLEGNPSATICDDPSTRVFYDWIHYTTDYHALLAGAIKQCSKDIPNYNVPLVSLLCPSDYAER